ncbi:MAG: hypothetical protein HFH09_01015 [Bacilli bacterium]|jgi:ABC-type sulfate transport system permease component|nr:hypothetical protein [Bacilli bacterium]
MERIIASIIVLVFIYLLYIVTVIHNKDKIKKFEKSGQAAFIIKKYKLTISKINMKNFARLIAFTNSFMIALVFFITDFIENYILKLLVGFIILLPTILLCYHLIGTFYKKKEGK